MIYDVIYASCRSCAFFYYNTFSSCVYVIRDEIIYQCYVGLRYT